MNKIEPKITLNHWKWVAKEWKGHGTSAIFLLFLTLLSTSVAMIFPLFFKFLIDYLANHFEKLTTTEAEAARLKFIVLLFIIGIIRFFGSLSPFFRARMNYLLEKQVRSRFFNILLQKSPAFFLQFRTGDLVTRLTDDIAGYPKVAWFSCSAIFRAINSGSVVLFCVIAMFWLNVKLAIFSLLPLPFGVFLYLVIKKKLEAAYQLQQKTVSQTNNHLESCFSGIRILKIFCAEKREGQRFIDVLTTRLDYEMKVVKLSGFMHIFFEFLSYAAQVLVILFGGLMVLDKQLSVGDYYAFFTYLSMIVYPMIDLPNLLVTSKQAFVCIDRLEELKNTEPDPLSENATGSIGKIETISFNNVDYQYNSDEKTILALKDVNLDIKQGENLAIVGRIGSGKTTLLKMICGFLSPTKGSITINGIPLTELEPSEYRRQIGYIAQEPLIFSETISQNIKFWREFDDASVKEAAHLSQFSDEIDNFPGGYSQEVGQRGVTISGGQKQRLTIARALLGHPEILVMDDVTASLDAENEQQFRREMEELFGDVTTIMVTHRLVTARSADRIIVLNDGKIEAIGTFEELLKNSSVFQDIAKEN